MENMKLQDALETRDWTSKCTTDRDSKVNVVMTYGQLETVVKALYQYNLYNIGGADNGKTL